MKLLTPMLRALPAALTSASAFRLSPSGNPGVGPVDQQQIDMIGAQLLQAFVHRALQIAGRDPLVPDLGREENVVTRDA